MSEVRPWEESPDDGYWQTALGAGPTAAEAQGAPPSSAGWTLAEKSFANGDILELRVVGHNRGGLLVDLGDTRGFVPSSQLSSFPRQIPEEQRMVALAQFVGSVLKLKVIELDRAHNRLILSERVVNPPASHAEQLLASIQPQEKRKGVIRNITDFGAFVDLGGVEGLVHVSELSWQYVKHPRDVLTPGQEVEVYVMEVNREQKRIACSLKRLSSNPWALAAEKLHPGDTIEGTITSVVGFGAFVRVADGVEGLVHVSEMEKGSQDPKDGLKEGQAVQVRVLEIDPNQQRLRLSLRINGSQSHRAHQPDRSNGTRHTVPPPPPPDPGYWDSLVQSGM
jgi:small subunit ribosomal protein S1